MGAGQEGAGENEAPETAGAEGGPESQSFDFGRGAPAENRPPRPVEAAPPRVDAPSPAPVTAAAPAPMPAPVVAHEPRQEWTPAPPSDATREGPRSEP